MKVVHNADVVQNYAGGRLLEQKNLPDKARDLYEKLLKKSPGNMKLLDRLIIVYRKLKDTRKEVAAIDQKIKIIEQHHGISGTVNSKVAALSKKLNLALKHTDRKGRNLLIHPQVLLLQERKKRLLKH